MSENTAATSQSGLATSGTIQQKAGIQAGDISAKYKSDMTKLFETRDLSKAGADLAYRSGELSAEATYQDTVTGIAAQPGASGSWGDKFMEGFTG